MMRMRHSQKMRSFGDNPTADSVTAKGTGEFHTGTEEIPWNLADHVALYKDEAGSGPIK